MNRTVCDSQCRSHGAKRAFGTGARISQTPTPALPRTQTQERRAYASPFYELPAAFLAWAWATATSSEQSTVDLTVSPPSEVSPDLPPTFDQEICAYNDGAALLATHAERLFDLVVVDLQMPGMAAEAVTRTLRADASTVGIVVVSGVGTAADWHRLSRLGADAFLLKPLSAEALVAVAQRAAPAGTRRSPRVGTPPDTVRGPRPLGGEPADTLPEPPKPRSE